MEKQLLLVLPAIIYGVAIVDLLKVYQNKHKYWEAIFWATILMVYIIIIWMELFAKLDTVSTNKYFYILIIVNAVLLSIGTSIITPDKETIDTKAYFLATKKQFFLFISLVVVLNLILQEFFYDDQRPVWLRLTVIALLITLAFTDNKPLRVAATSIMGAAMLFILLAP